jgi:hypothetical protein
MIKMNHKRFLFITSILCFLLLFNIVKAELSEDDIKYILSDQNQLDILKNQINNASETAPSSIRKAILGHDRMYYVKIGDSDIGMSVKDGKVVEMWPGVPESPTHIIATDYKAILEFANSDNPPLTAAKLFAEKKIEINQIGSYNEENNIFGNILKDISSNWEIVVVAVLILIAALIVFFVIKFKDKEVKDEILQIDNEKKVKETVKPVEMQKEPETPIETKPSETPIVQEEQKSPVDKLIDEFEKNKDENV